jgi:hypothetical protein
MPSQFDDDPQRHHDDHLSGVIIYCNTPCMGIPAEIPSRGGGQQVTSCRLGGGSRFPRRSKKAQYPELCAHRPAHYSGNVHFILREHDQEKFKEHDQGTFSEHSRNIQGTFSRHTHTHTHTLQLRMTYQGRCPA